MRITSKRTDVDTTGKVRRLGRSFRDALAPLAIGVVAGLIVAVWLGQGPTSAAWASLNASARNWLSEAREDVETAIGTDDLPILRLDIGFEAYHSLAAKREQALEIGVLTVGDED